MTPAQGASFLYKYLKKHGRQELITELYRWQTFGNERGKIVHEILKFIANLTEEEKDKLYRGVKVEKKHH